MRETNRNAKPVIPYEPVEDVSVLKRAHLKVLSAAFRRQQSLSDDDILIVSIQTFMHAENDRRKGFVPVTPQFPPTDSDTSLSERYLVMLEQSLSSSIKKCETSQRTHLRCPISYRQAAEEGV